MSICIVFRGMKHAEAGCSGLWNSHVLPQSRDINLQHILLFNEYLLLWEDKSENSEKELKVMHLNSLFRANNISKNIPF